MCNKLKLTHVLNVVIHSYSVMDDDVTGYEGIDYTYNCTL